MTWIGRSNPCFEPTCWSEVRRAGDPDQPGAREAMEALVGRYWRPVYLFIRRRGSPVEDAKDLTQEFFGRLLDGPGLAGADPAQGRFRNYLLGAVRHFLSDAADRERAAKRGGGRRIESLDFAGAEAWYRCEPADDADPARLFERAWAAEVVESAIARLGETLSQEGRERWFECLRLHLSAERPTYQAIAERLGCSTGDVTNWLHRARRRLREEVVGVLMDSVASAAEAEEELAELFRSFR